MHHEDCIGRLCFDIAERAPSLKFSALNGVRLGIAEDMCRPRRTARRAPRRPPPLRRRRALVLWAHLDLISRRGSVAFVLSLPRSRGEVLLLYVFGVSGWLVGGVNEMSMKKEYRNSEWNEMKCMSTGMK